MMGLGRGTCVWDPCQRVLDHSLVVIALMSRNRESTGLASGVLWALVLAPRVCICRLVASVQDQHDHRGMAEGHDTRPN